MVMRWGDECVMGCDIAGVCVSWGIWVSGLWGWSGRLVNVGVVWGSIPYVVAMWAIVGVGVNGGSWGFDSAWRVVIS